MLTKLSIKNFRSLEKMDLDLAPITVLYGPTGSGKSSLLYALMVLRNFVTNPNRQADGFFHVGFMDLGGFDACIFNHDAKKTIDMAASFKDPADASYGVSFSKIGCDVHQMMGQTAMKAKFPLPYGLNQTLPFSFEFEGQKYTANWNGIACNVVPEKPTADTQQIAVGLAGKINSFVETIKAMDIVPHKRGFFKPSYTPSPVSLIPTTEDEVASIIINDINMAGRVSAYLEEILGRDFRTHTPPGTSTFFFHTTEKKSKVPQLMINDGFGVNQIVYLLTKMLRIDVKTVLIEEPEIHLHPTALRKFVRALCTISKEEEKQVILTTHSEQFMISLLTAVSEKHIEADKVKCYLTTKENRSTRFQEQKVDADGEIQGGLGSFIEAETEDLQRFLKVAKTA